MVPLLHETESQHTPESLAAHLRTEPGTMVLRSALLDSPFGRYSFVVARPFLIMRSYGPRCELVFPNRHHVQFGNPWRVLDSLMARYELVDEVDLPFPLGGCFGYWGYDLKNFVEPKLQRRAVNDLELPDCWVGFYNSLVAFDHRLNKIWIVATGLGADGSREATRLRAQKEYWQRLLEQAPLEGADPSPVPERQPQAAPIVTSSTSREGFLSSVQRAKDYIRTGDIYQVNLSHRLETHAAEDRWDLFVRLTGVSPSAFAAFLQADDFQVVSSSPELFLRMNGSQVVTRPIKGTRPRSSDLTRDAQWTYQLLTSQKELAELLMITDLLRNDLGRICEYGSVQVPEIVRLERYSQVQHLVSTIEGALRHNRSHFEAFSSCFPGGSITGAPKFRAMEIIDELEPVTRGPYTGCLGYVGFNRETQLSILIRTAVGRGDTTAFHVGAGIVADSDPEAEYEETIAKGRGFLAALGCQANSPIEVAEATPYRIRRD